MSATVRAPRWTTATAPRRAIFVCSWQRPFYNGLLHMISLGTRLSVVGSVASLASLVYAQDTSFRSRADLVIVPTTVTDRTGRFVRGLTAADFAVLEDDVRRPIAQFSAQRVPVSVAIVLDISGSMSTEPGRWDLTQRALASFLARLEGND